MIAWPNRTNRDRVQFKTSQTASNILLLTFSCYHWEKGFVMTNLLQKISKQRHHKGNALSSGSVYRLQRVLVLSNLACLDHNRNFDLHVRCFGFTGMIFAAFLDFHRISGYGYRFRTRHGRELSLSI